MYCKKISGVRLVALTAPLPFPVDRPSIFYITVKNVIVLMGRMGDPEF